MDEKMIVGFDLDGVVFNPPLPFYRWVKKINLDFFVYRFRKIAAAKKTFYRLIRVNQPISRIMNQLAENGHKIIIISGHAIECLEEVSNCLKENRIPFNGLSLRPDGNEYSQFKLEEIIKARCSVYIEDRKDIVYFLRRELNDFCQIVHFRNDPTSFIELEKIIQID